MFVKEWGRGGRTFVAFHGWGGDHREFAPLAARLPENARLLSPDLPGYGQSAPPEDWSLQAIQQTLEEALRGRADRVEAVIGFCSGAVFALPLARHWGHRIQRMVLIDPFAFVPWYFRLFLAGEFGRRAYATTFASPLGRKITNSILRWKQSSRENFTDAFTRIDHDIVRRYLELFDGFGSLEPYRELTLPVDMATGEKTFGAVRKSVRLFCEVWPQARVVELAGTGHLPLIKGARRLRRLVFEDQ